MCVFSYTVMEGGPIKHVGERHTDEKEFPNFN